MNRIGSVALAGVLLAGTVGGSAMAETLAQRAPAVRATPAPARGADRGAATILSSVAPGLGEAYNSGWRTGFPWVECLASSFLMGTGGLAISNVLYGVPALAGAAPWVGWAATVAGTAMRLTSMIDAASGVSSDNIRFDFWSLPGS